MPRHWDDLELLRTLDRLETESPGVMRDGRTLMEAAAGEPVPDERDQARFVHELHLARDAGYLTFRPVEWVGMAPPDPRDPNMYLQRTTDFALTLAGRDRARGRVVELPPPDPDEDDGRAIGLMTIEEVARQIGDSYTGERLPLFLEESNVPREFIPPFAGTKWRYVADMLTAMLEGGAARRAAREFLAPGSTTASTPGLTAMSRRGCSVTSPAKAGTCTTGGWSLASASSASLRPRRSRAKAPSRSSTNACARRPNASTAMDTTRLPSSRPTRPSSSACAS